MRARWRRCRFSPLPRAVQARFPFPFPSLAFPGWVCRTRPRLLPAHPVCFLSAADINLNSPNKGLLADAMTDVPVDSSAAARTAAPEGLTAAEEEELRAEIAKVRESLSRVLLGGKEQELGVLQEQGSGVLFCF